MTLNINRRNLIAGAGALTVAVVLPGRRARAAIFGAEKRPALDPKKLASYISINGDGSVVSRQLLDTRFDRQPEMFLKAPPPRFGQMD